MNTVKVLSIDGGGIRGIIPAMILAKIEETLGKPICELFDLITGTSTGGIISLALTKPASGSDTRPAYKAGELIKLYSEEGKKIFHTPVLHKIRSIGGIIDEKYPSQGIEEVLKGYFGDSRLSQALTPVLIPAYETELRTPFLFKSLYAKNHGKYSYDFYMWQVARAASAAPTYFEAFKLPADEISKYYSLIDGGVYANNPAMCAFVEAKTMFPDAAQFLVVSLGTGKFTRMLPYNDIKHWGLIKWAHPILSVVFDGISDTVDYQLRQLLPKNMYYRFQVNLTQLGEDDLDDASEQNIYELKLLTQEFINRNERNGTFKKLVNSLLPEA